MMRNYPASREGRVMIDLRWCDPFPGGRDALVRIIHDQLGYASLWSDPVEIARQLVGTGEYKLEAECGDAPDIIDCSSLMRWVYGSIGILLPRSSIDQLAYGDPVTLIDLKSGDLLFTTGPQNFFVTDQEDGVGHVGLFTERRTVIEASPGSYAVKELPLKEFLSLPRRRFKGACRILPPKEERLVLELGRRGQDVHFGKDLLRFAQKQLPIEH